MPPPSGPASGHLVPGRRLRHAKGVLSARRNLPIGDSIGLGTGSVRLGEPARLQRVHLDQRKRLAKRRLERLVIRPPSRACEHALSHCLAGHCKCPRRGQWSARKRSAQPGPCPAIWQKCEILRPGSRSAVPHHLPAGMRPDGISKSLSSLQAATAGQWSTPMV